MTNGDDDDNDKNDNDNTDSLNCLAATAQVNPC